MPFPWKKKNRVTRISQLVADLQFQSPKHGGSLVVETGFPTSLIDLFVKNRSRFKKPRYKKPLQTEIADLPPPPPPPSPATSPPLITELLIPDSPSALENTAATATAPVTESGSVSSAKAVMVKILTVMILVAIGKWFTVGITVSAFALVFLEYAGKRAVLRIKPCPDAIVALERFQKVLFKGTVESGGVENELSVNLTCDEIEVLEAKSELGIDCNYDDSLVYSSKIRGSRSGRFKSMMAKKLMKFRGSKKEKKENKSESDVSSVAAEEEEVKLSSFEIEEQDEAEFLREHPIKLEEVKKLQEQRARAESEKEEKLKESNAKVSLENEVSALRSEVAALQQKFGTGAHDKNGDVEVLQVGISDREKEINRLKELVEKERVRANSERKTAEDEKKNAAKAQKLLEAEKKISVAKGMQLAKTEAEKSEALASEASKLEEATIRFKAEEQKLLVEKINAESEMKKAQKQVEVEKQKAAREKQHAYAELSKLKEQKRLAEDNQKSATETKCLADQMSQELVENKKTIEELKQKLLVEKINADSEMKKAQKQVEVEKQKAAREKQRAYAELTKLKEQKRLAEDNQKSAMETKCLADQMSRELVENKKTIEELKQKIHGLSSLRKPNEISGVSPDVKAESTQVQVLRNSLELEKLRAKHAREKLKHERKKFKNERLKFKYEESCRNILQHELHRLKLDFIQYYHHLNLLEASISSVPGSIHGLTKSQNMPSMQKSDVTTQLCNLGMPQMHNCVENEFMKPCNTGRGACDSLRKSMQSTPLLAISEGHYAGSIAGVGSKVEPLIRDSNKMIQNYAVNSSTSSFSDAHLMGSQERGSIQVTVPKKSANENFNARPSMLNPPDRSVIKNDQMGNKICDTIECIANLSSDGKTLNMQLEDRLTDLRGLLYSKMDKSAEGGKDIISNNRDNLQAESGRAHKKRKKSHRAKGDVSVGEKKIIEEPKAGFNEDADGYRKTTCPALYTHTTQAAGERMFDASDKFDDVFDGNIMKLFDLDNAVDEERYRRAMDAPLSPLSFREIELCDMDNLKETVHVDSQKDPLPSTRCDVIDDEINSDMPKFDAFTIPCSAHNSTHARQTDVKLQDNQNLRDTSQAETGSLHNQLCNLSLVLSDGEDYSSISRTFLASRNCIARCSLDTRIGWAVPSILTAVEMEEMSLQKEKHSVLLTLLLFNFTMTTAEKLGEFGGGNLILCLNSYAKHIRGVMTDADTRVLFLEKFSLNELLRLIEDFLIEGKVKTKNIGPSETSSGSDLRKSFLDGIDKLSSELASDEQLIAASIILASLCAATDYIGFISEASYNFLRLSRHDSLTVLTILHIFAKLGGRKYFDMDECGLMVTVLKSLVKFLEEGSISVINDSGLPPINQLHIESCTKDECPFSEGAESIDIVTLLLLEKIKNCLFQHAEQFNSSNFRFSSDNYNTGQWSNKEEVQCASSMNCDVRLKKHVACPNQPDCLIDVTLCQLSEILSLLELVANKMSWQWTNAKLVPQLLHILDSCTVEKCGVAIIVLIGHLGRFGVDVGGYDDQGVQNLRCNLFSYLCDSPMKAGSSLQIATATALFGLLPLDLETLLHTKSGLPAYSSKSISDDAGNLRKWFFGLGENQRDLLCDILRPTDPVK